MNAFTFGAGRLCMKGKIVNKPLTKEELQRAISIGQEFSGQLKAGLVGWDLYCEFYEILPVDSFCPQWIEEVLGEENVSLFDDFYIEKYETVDYIEFLEKIKKSKKFPDFNESLFIHYVLKSGERGFVYDW